MKTLIISYSLTGNNEALAIADLLPAEPKPQRKDTMAFRVTEENVRMLAEKVVLQVAAFTR